jgi:high-affinity nickel-transport protein
LLTAVLLGFVLGIRHAADPDHLAAIAALVARHRNPWAAARIGAAWGLGHGLMILAVGGAFVALRITVVPFWARVADLGVAAILVWLGVSNLRSLRTAPSEPTPSPGVSPQAAEGGAQRAEGERSSSGRAAAQQPNQPQPDASEAHKDALRLSDPIGRRPILGSVLVRPLFIGMAHGLAGSAAVALLALAAMPSPRAALAYLVVFGAGTVASMVAMSLGLGVPAARASARPAFVRWVVAGSGALSIGVGIYLAVAVGVARDLL